MKRQLELDDKEIQILIRAMQASWFPRDEERQAYDLILKLRKVIQ